MILAEDILKIIEDEVKWWEKSRDTHSEIGDYENAYKAEIRRSCYNGLRQEINELIKNEKKNV